MYWGQDLGPMNILCEFEKDPFKTQWWRTQEKQTQLPTDQNWNPNTQDTQIVLDEDWTWIQVDIS